MKTTDLLKLDENELIDLRTQINNRIKAARKEAGDDLKRQESVGGKTKLTQLTHTDRIFVICTEYNEVRRMGYYNVHSVKKGENNSEWYSFYIGDVGGSFDTIEANNHYLLYKRNDYLQYFFTLKPETWQEDIKSALEYQLKRERAFHRKQYKRMTNEVKSFLLESDKINNYISEKLK